MGLEASQAAEWVGSSRALSVPPSSRAMVKVTLGKEKTGCRYAREISAPLM
jgi:hypothetical protein